MEAVIIFLSMLLIVLTGGHFVNDLTKCLEQRKYGYAGIGVICLVWIVYSGYKVLTMYGLNVFA